MSKQGGRIRAGRRLWRTAAGLLLLAVLCLGISGCFGRPEKRESLEPGEYWVYYVNASMTRLVPYAYRPEATKPDEVIAELMEQIRTAPADVDCQPPLSDKVAFQAFKQEDQVLYLYFDANYTTMKAEQEILCRAALTRTLTQVEGVEYINIYTGDQPLMDRNKNPVGMLAADDFIMNTSNVNAYEKAELVLYFADETGTKLEAETREVMHSINTSLEQLVVEQLIAGPREEGHFATLPENLRILNLTVTDSVCYINFDGAFLEGKAGVSEYIPIYSIVNSLSELTTVTKVRILVNGSQDEVFRDVVSLNTAFERNGEYMDEGTQAR